MRRGQRDQAGPFQLHPSSIHWFVSSRSSRNKRLVDCGWNAGSASKVKCSPADTCMVWSMLVLKSGKTRTDFLFNADAFKTSDSWSAVSPSNNWGATPFASYCAILVFAISITSCQTPSCDTVITLWCSWSTMAFLVLRYVLVALYRGYGVSCILEWQDALNPFFNQSLTQLYTSLYSMWRANLGLCVSGLLPAHCWVIFWGHLVVCWGRS